MSNFPQKITPARDLKECAICSRRFTLDRINIHETVCKNSTNLVRKRFDVNQQRITGTEIERFIAENKDCFRTPPKNSPRALSTNWRRREEEFIQKVNEARKKSEKTIKVSDLPLPPPVESDDFIQCPHCLRLINQQSAMRHIEACANRMCDPDLKTSESDVKGKASKLTGVNNMANPSSHVKNEN